MRNTFIDTVLKFSRNNPPPYLLTGDLGYSVLELFQKEFPARFINVGILEQSMMSMSAGIASQNQKVFAYSISNFSTFRALEQLRLDIAYHNLDVCIVGVGTGFQYGSAGYSHWAIEDLSAVSGLEKMRIYSPSDPESTSEVVLDFLSNGGPSYLRLGRQNLSLKTISGFVKVGKHVNQYGSGNKLIASHGSIAIKVLQSKYFDQNIHKLIVFNEIPALINKDFFDIFSEAQSVKVLEDVVYPGSLGSKICRFLLEKRLNKTFDWIGVDGKTLKSAGGSEEYLRSRELGTNYIENILK
jgi:transketolase